MEKRKETNWEEIIADYRNSGLKQTEWCKMHGINIYTLRNQISKMKKSHKQDAGMPGIQKQSKKIKWLPVTQAEETKKAAEREIHVQIGDFTILIESDFDEVTLSRLCKTLAAIC